MRSKRLLLRLLLERQAEMAKHRPVPGVVGLRGTDHGYQDSCDYGYAPVESDCVISAYSVNTFERHVLPGATSNDTHAKSHLTEGLKGFFGNAGRSDD